MHRHPCSLVGISDRKTKKTVLLAVLLLPLALVYHHNAVVVAGFSFWAYPSRRHETRGVAFEVFRRQGHDGARAAITAFTLSSTTTTTALSSLPAGHKPWALAGAKGSAKLVDSATRFTTNLRMSVTSINDVIAAENEEKDTDDDAEQPKMIFNWQNQWFPLMPISYLRGLDSNKPVPVSVLGRKLVIWNSSSAATTTSTITDGKGENHENWSVFEDVCPHRRSPLSTGQVVNGCLMCRYHGWEFAADGKVAKFPMQVSTNGTTPIANKAAKAPPTIHANSFSCQVAGGILWAFLGTPGVDGNIPQIPPGSTPTDEEIGGADWMFNRNPISYTSMMENTFDPAHAPFTHESMTGYAGIAFSPTDVVPVTRYDVREPPTAAGFVIEHTPYQHSVARVAGPDNLTMRKFIPPCTVAVASLPFFQTKMWFVPSNVYETNVLAFFKSPDLRLVRWFRSFPKLQELIRDYVHTQQYLGDWNYRFLSQDRITMQGQDERKMGSKSLKDLTPDPSDTGVAIFQHWLQFIAGGGPFANAANALSKTPNHQHVSPQNVFDRELSFWDSHGMYCPRCQRSMRRVSAIKTIAGRWSRGVFTVAILSAFLAAGSSLVVATRTTTATSIGRASIVLSAFTMNLLVTAGCLRSLVDWCRHKETRMYGIGASIWTPGQSVFGYRNAKSF